MLRRGWLALSKHTSFDELSSKISYEKFCGVDERWRRKGTSFFKPLRLALFSQIGEIRVALKLKQIVCDVTNIFSRISWTWCTSHTTRDHDCGKNLSEKSVAASIDAFVRSLRRARGSERLEKFVEQQAVCLFFLKNSKVV
jgi:hypothetical protein